MRERKSARHVSFHLRPTGRSGGHGRENSGRPRSRPWRQHWRLVCCDGGGSKSVTGRCVAAAAGPREQRNRNHVRLCHRSEHPWQQLDESLTNAVQRRRGTAIHIRCSVQRQPVSRNVPRERSVFRRYDSYNTAGDFAVGPRSRTRKRVLPMRNSSTSSTPHVSGSATQKREGQPTGESALKYIAAAAP